MCCGDNIKTLTVWFGKEISIDEVKAEVRSLRSDGYRVTPPFYIGYDISDSLVLSYLETSLDNSDALYLIGSEGSLLNSIVDYSEKMGKPILRMGVYA